MLKRQVKWMKFLSLLCILSVPFGGFCSQSHLFGMNTAPTLPAGSEFSKHVVANPVSPLSEEKITLRIIQGKVTDVNGNPLTGVSVNIEGTTKGTATDADGQFSIDAGDNATLVFSFVGYKSHRENVSSRSTVDVV
ncbi:MAG: carboxypeptidase-like regulatory domain-containing protein, partial [Ginsengibacter sp.]